MTRTLRLILAALAVSLGALTLAVSAASADDGPVLFPPPSSIAWVETCSTVGVDPPVAVQVWVNVYDSDGTFLGRETIDFDPAKAGTFEAIIDVSSLVDGHKGHVTAGYTLSGDAESASLPYDCLPPETTTTTTAPPTTTTAPPTTEPQEHPVPPPSIGTPTSVVPVASTAPITSTCPEGSGSDGCLAFTGASSHTPREVGLGAALVLLGSVALAGPRTIAEIRRRRTAVR